MRLVGGSYLHASSIHPMEKTEQDERLNLSELEDPIFIAVMGMRGSGKSTFIQGLVSQEVDFSPSVRSVYVLNAQDSPKVNTYTTTLDGRAIVFVELPGFDHAFPPALAVLKSVAYFFSISHKENARLSAIIYMHPITKIHMEGAPLLNLKFFMDLCGIENASRATIVTSMWDNVELKNGFAVERMLRDAIDWNAPFLKRFEGDRKLCSRSIARRILKQIRQPYSKHPFQIQSELVDERKTLTETKVGRRCLEAAYGNLADPTRVTEPLRESWEGRLSPRYIASENREEKEVAPVEASHGGIEQFELDILEDAPIYSAVAARRDETMMKFRQDIDSLRQLNADLVQQRVEAEQEYQALVSRVETPPSVQAGQQPSNTDIDLATKDLMVDGVSEMPGLIMAARQRKITIRQAQDEQRSHLFSRYDSFYNVLFNRNAQDELEQVRLVSSSEEELSHAPYESSNSSGAEDEEDEHSKGEAATELTDPKYKTITAEYGAYLDLKHGICRDSILSAKLTNGLTPLELSERQFCESILALPQMDVPSARYLSPLPESDELDFDPKHLGTPRGSLHRLQSKYQSGLDAWKEFRSKNEHLQLELVNNPIIGLTHVFEILRSTKECLVMAWHVAHNFAKLSKMNRSHELQYLAISDHENINIATIKSISGEVLESFLNFVMTGSTSMFTLFIRLTDLSEDDRGHSPSSLRFISSCMSEVPDIVQLSIKAGELFAFTLHAMGLGNLVSEEFQRLLVRPHHSQKISDFFAIRSIAWRWLLSLLDLLILSRSRAHLTHLIKFLDGTSPNEVRLLPFLRDRQFRLEDVHRDWWTHLPRVGLKKRSFACLNQFLDSQQVWVLSDLEIDSSQDLQLLTPIYRFSALWGPTWKILAGRNNEDVSCFRTNSGFILPWKQSGSQISQDLQHAKFCHYVTSENFSSCMARGGTFPGVEMEITDDTSHSTQANSDYGVEDFLALDMDAAPFTDDQFLLIGASLGRSGPKLRQRNRNDAQSTFHFEQNMSQAGLMSDLQTKKSRYRWKYDQPILNINPHGCGFSLPLRRTEDEEIRLKEVIVNTWKEYPRRRHPRELLDFWGLQVSISTMNARRVRLTELLVTDSVRRILDEFHWSDRIQTDDPTVLESKKKNALINALDSRNPIELIKLWQENVPWQQELGDALAECLHDLSLTGFHDYNELNVLWFPKWHKRPQKITLKASEHSWIHLLKDTHKSMTMAVLIEQRLELPVRCDYGRRTSELRTRPTVLETAIHVTERDIPSGLRPLPVNGDSDLLHPKWRTADPDWNLIWEVSRAERGENLSVSTARLLVEKIIDEKHLLLKCERPPIFGRRQYHHWEYAQESLCDHHQGCLIRPIPVHLI